MPSAIYLTADIRRIEEKAGPHAGLMERAGLAAADFAAQLVADRGKDVLVLAGPGNNGGDAYEVAANLKAEYFRVSVVSPADPAGLSRDAANARSKWLDSGGEIHPAAPADRKWALVVDGLFGIGLTRD
ncbi:MAG TPA: NAD(P)H-hydrate epimerase, partial [Burkholderiales bacterium]|nr:NAD(P)H-hydrate epimerase [Burkholderiales bacterium]